MRRYCKDSFLYRIAIMYTLFFVVAVIFTGVWLFLLSLSDEGGRMVDGIIVLMTDAPMRSWHRFIEVATPHLAAMGMTLFVLAHFLLFSTRIDPKTARGASIMLFVWMFADIFATAPLVTGMVKLIALGGLVLFVVVLVGMLAYSL